MKLNIGLVGIIVIVGAIALITIFPTNLCLPFSDICLFLTPLHTLKKALSFGVGLFLFYGWWIAIFYLLGRGLYNFSKYPMIRHGIMFLITFSDKNWNGLLNSLRNSRIRD